MHARTVTTFLIFFLIACLLWATAAGRAVAAPADDLLTVAEASEYTRTSTYDEVVDLMNRIAARSDHMRMTEMGTTHEGRSIPLAIIADPPITTPRQAHESGKAIIFAFANIHAGEVCGKEALLQLMREFALEPDHPFLEDLIFLIAPIYNADGNERFAPVAQNRPGQVGPEEVGVRRNAQDLDLNRDFMKLEAPETRALVRLLTEWDPHLTIDCHTTNGSFHRYTLTYDTALNPSGVREPIDFVRNQLLPAVTDRVRESTGYEMFFYGNFNRDMTAWATYSHEPRFGCPYRGLRGQMTVLSEAYSYAPFKNRVVCTREFVREIARFAAEKRAEIIEIHERARQHTTSRGRNPQPDDVVGIRYRLAAFPNPVAIKGWEMEGPGPGEPGRRGVRPRPTDVPKDYAVVHLGRFEATHSVARPFAYVIEPGYEDLVAKLRDHGVVVEPFISNAPLTTETYTITRMQRSPRPFEGHVIHTLEVEATLMARNDFTAGSYFVPTAQPLGNLIVYLLEPQSDDGFAAWGLFGERISEGGRYPVARIRHPRDLE